MVNERTTTRQLPDVLARLASGAQSRLPASRRSPRARALGMVLCTLLGVMVVVAATGAWF